MAEPVRGPDGKPIRLFRDRKAWARWLATHHASSTGLWLRLAKKASGQTSVSYQDALGVALAFGWIDGQARREDADYSLLKFTPRAKRSIWSKRNRDRALALIASGEMQPSGLAEVERARKDGRWDRAYDPPTEAVVPPDLEAALRRNARARVAFATIDRQNRYAILFRLQTAKKPETRARRLQQFVAMLEQRQTVPSGKRVAVPKSKASADRSPHHHVTRTPPRKR